MSDKYYKALRPEQKAILDGFPTLSASELAAVNDMFQHYVFYKSVKGGKTLWTSCCGKNGIFNADLQQTMTPELWAISFGKHNDSVTCPFCGKKATLKCVGKLGRKLKITQYIPVVFLHEVNGDIYAQSYWARKTYDDLSQEPHYMVTCVYHFTPGKATMFYEAHVDYKKYEWTVVVEPQKGSKRKITEPFIGGSGMFLKYEYYKVINIDALETSAFKYCQYTEWARQNDTYRYFNKHFNLMKYLTAACQYPYTLEMLMKNGTSSKFDYPCSMKLVNDLMFYGKKKR